MNNLVNRIIAENKDYASKILFEITYFIKLLDKT